MDKTELKVKAASWAAFIVAGVGLSVLGAVSTDFVPALPDLLEAPAYALIASAVVWLTGYQTRNRPESLAPSTRAAVRGEHV